MAALRAGVMDVTLEFGTKLKDKDWFGRQDPYAILTCGAQKFRSRTHTDGGRNPVWNQTFTFNVMNENDMTITVMDADLVSRDDLIGVAHVTFTNARNLGSDRVQVPVVGRSGKQHGYVSLFLRFTPQAGAMQPLGAAPYPYPMQQQQPYPGAYGQPQPYGAPPPAAGGYYYPPPAAGAGAPFGAAAPYGGSPYPQYQQVPYGGSQYPSAPQYPQYQAPMAPRY